MTLEKKTQHLIDFKILEAVREYRRYNNDLIPLLKEGCHLSEIKTKAENFRRYLDQFNPDDLKNIDHVIAYELKFQYFLYSTLN